MSDIFLIGQNIEKFIITNLTLKTCKVAFISLVITISELYNFPEILQFDILKSVLICLMITNFKVRYPGTEERLSRKYKIMHIPAKFSDVQSLKTLITKIL